MKVIKKKYFFIFLFILFGCQSHENNCNPKIATFGNEEFRVEGCIADQLEEGEWRFYDKSNYLSEKGFFEKGIRIGRWFYPKNKSDSIIEWRKFYKPSNGLCFNIPNGLEVIEQDSVFIKFSNTDSTKLFNLVLAFSDLSPNFIVEQYHFEAQNEIIKRGWQFKSKRQQLLVEDNTFYYDEYSMKISEHDSARLISIYAIIGDKFFELDCQYPIIISTTSNIIFFSVLGNLFFNQNRIFDPFAKIKEIREIDAN